MKIVDTNMPALRRMEALIMQIEELKKKFDDFSGRYQSTTERFLVDLNKTNDKISQVGSKLSEVHLKAVDAEQRLKTHEKSLDDLRSLIGDEVAKAKQSALEKCNDLADELREYSAILARCDSFSNNIRFEMQEMKINIEKQERNLDLKIMQFHPQEHGMVS